MRKPLFTLLSYVVFLPLLFVLLAHLIGPATLLEYAEQGLPYSKVFASEKRIPPATKASDIRILFLGDSSVITVACPIVELRIPSMLETEMNQRYPELGHVSVIDWAFHGGNSFHFYCLLFAAEEQSPDLVVAPINWRTFGDSFEQWREKFKFHELARLVPLTERLRDRQNNPLVLEGISVSGQLLYCFDMPRLYAHGLRGWSRTVLASGLSPKTEADEAMPGAATIVSTVPNWRETLTNRSDASLFGTHPIEVSPDLAGMKHIQYVAETASRRKIPFLYYITPIHVEEMKKRRSFDYARFSQSVQTVVSAASVGTTECVSFIELLGEDDFVDYYEHYSEEGNRKIAQALARETRRILLQSRHVSGNSESAAMRNRMRRHRTN